MVTPGTRKTFYFWTFHGVKQSFRRRRTISWLPRCVTHFSCACAIRLLQMCASIRFSVKWNIGLACAEYVLVAQPARRHCCQSLSRAARGLCEFTAKNFFWKQPTYLHFICLLIVNQLVNECMLPFWTYTNLHSQKQGREVVGQKCRICLIISAVYAFFSAVYKVYSGGIHFVFSQNTLLLNLFMSASMRAIGITRREAETSVRT